LLVAILRPWASQDAAHGALPTLYAATSPDAQAGGYYGPDGPLETKGHPIAVPIPKQAIDTAVARRLWSISEDLTGVSYGQLSSHGDPSSVGVLHPAREARARRSVLALVHSLLC
jgi:hypothetical protein